MRHRHSQRFSDHGQTHSSTNMKLSENRQATRVLLISLAVMLFTAVIQALIVMMSGSVGLLADTIHNFGDALTSIPLWLAFWLSRRPPTKRFSYGLNRSEDLAGLLIVTVISISALVVGYASVLRIVHRTEPTHLWAVAVGAVVGFVGNEFAAVIRMRMGTRMGSAALVADGRHAQIDGFTSLAVLLGVLGVWFGYPFVDPVVGLAITVMILVVVKDSATTVFSRLLDGIEPDVIDKVKATAESVDGVCQVTHVRARWFGHGIHAELTIAVDGQLSVQIGNDLIKTITDDLTRTIPHLDNVEVRMSPFELPVFNDSTHLDSGDNVRESDIGLAGVQCIVEENSRREPVV